MIFSCDICSTQLQIDEAKAPVGKFTIRCPKCKNLVRVQIRGESKPEASPEVAADKKNSEALPQPEAAYKPEIAETPPQPESANSAELLRALAGLMQQTSGADNPVAAGMQNKNQMQRVLLCLGAANRDMAARVLSEAGYQVFLGETPQQAIETVRDTNVGIVIFSPDFAFEQKGAFVLQKHFNMFTGLQRRKLFIVSLEDSTHSFDTHEAFLKNLNLVVHSSDTRNLPTLLRRALRDFEEMYHYYKAAMPV